MPKPNAKEKSKKVDEGHFEIWAEEPPKDGARMERPELPLMLFLFLIVIIALLPRCQTLKKTA